MQSDLKRNLLVLTLVAQLFVHEITESHALVSSAVVMTGAVTLDVGMGEDLVTKSKSCRSAEANMRKSTLATISKRDVEPKIKSHARQRSSGNACSTAPEYMGARNPGIMLATLQTAYRVPWKRLVISAGSVKSLAT